MGNLQPTWTFHAERCFAKAWECCPAKLAPGNQYASTELLLTWLTIESPIARVVRDASDSGADCACSQRADDTEESEEWAQEEPPRDWNIVRL